MKKILFFCIYAMSALTTNGLVAADYTSSGTRVPDDDYIYFSDGYMCSDTSINSVSNPNSFKILTDGQTLYDSQKRELLLCCEFYGYWVSYGNVQSLPAIPTCGTKYNWVSLGANRYCQATMKSTYDRCDNLNGSGVIPSSNATGACQYSNGTCTTFTHCGRGYYKDGNTCIQCPDGGTTSGYTNNGITACKLQSGTNSADATGTFLISGGSCPYLI